MSAADVEGRIDFFCFGIPIEGIFHFVAIKPFGVVGFYLGDFYIPEVDMLFGERFADEGGFGVEFIRPGEDLEGRGREKTSVFWADAEGGGRFDRESDSLLVGRFLLCDEDSIYGFSREGVPEEDFLAGF